MHQRADWRPDRRTLQAAEAAAWGSAWHHAGLVFTRENDPASVTDTFQALFAAAGLQPIRLHDLRHTAGSLAPRSGWR